VLHGFKAFYRVLFLVASFFQRQDLREYFIQLSCVGQNQLRGILTLILAVLDIRFQLFRDKVLQLLVLRLLVLF
jgi:hypothetical protein